MMTSMGGNRARGSWEQTQGQTQSQTQHKQRPQATAEQIRLAQMISDHNDADFEEKVKQLIDITGKDQDESMIALHDCNGDVNRAINVLLEGSPDTDSWEMVGKKKGVSGQKEASQAETGEEGKENREKGGEKDVARRRGGAQRKGRGTSRGREFRGQENGLDGAKAGVAGRGAERGRRGRGRGRGTAGNEGNASSQNKSIFLGRGMIFIITLTSFLTATEEWGTEDWNEDVSVSGLDLMQLSETKIFTASNVASMPLPQENVTITKGQRIDLAVLLGKTPPSSSSETENPPMEAAQPPSLSQSLVFSNSKQGVPLSQTSSSTPYTQHSMVSMLSKGFGEVGDPKGGSTGTTGSQFLEQYKTAQALAQLAAQHSQSGPPNTAPSSWDNNATSLGQYDMKAQPESAVHAPFTKRQPYQTATSTSSMLDVFLQDKAVPSLGQQVSPSSSDPQGSSPLPLQQHKLKQQKKRTSITTKIPAMAVEMPGSADISGLNLQFGALQFGSEPVLPEYESTPSTTTPANQVQNSLYTSPSRLVHLQLNKSASLFSNIFLVSQPQVYGYDDLQMLQTRIPLDYYSIPFATPTTALTGREGSLTSNPYSGDLSKFGRGDASSPAPATTLAQTQQNQTQTHHTTQQPFLNPGLPPGYSYTSLPYYTGMPGLPNTFQYGPAVFPVAPTSSKQHGVNVGVNASATPFQQASGYGSHGYSTGEALNHDETAFLEGSCRSCSVYLHTNNSAPHNKPINFSLVWSAYVI
uniref:Ubiquitin associated protein 2-like n=1 Tax=Mastacembelus armatus TaxID=205130 RepID=A0A7N9AT46_9TELE